MKAVNIYKQYIHILDIYEVIQSDSHMEVQQSIKWCRFRSRASVNLLKHQIGKRGMARQVRADYCRLKHALLTTTVSRKASQNTQCIGLWCGRATTTKEQESKPSGYMFTQIRPLKITWSRRLNERIEVWFDTRVSFCWFRYFII